jgi:hypothetical protein
MALMPLRFASAHRFLAASESFFLPAAVSCPLLGASTFADVSFEAFGDALRFVELLRCRVRVATRADTDPLVRLGPSISRSAVRGIPARAVCRFGPIALAKLGPPGIAAENEQDSIGSAHEQNLQGGAHESGVSTADRIH